MSVKESKIMLDEMHHAFDTVYASVRKYNDKTFMEFGAELAFLLFYLSGDEINGLKMLFEKMSSGWYIFAVFALISFVVAAILFIIALTIGKWHIPPDDKILLERHQYSKMKEEDLLDELIDEYNEDVSHCIRKVRNIKQLSDVGLYFLVFGAASLLIIKFFGV